MRAHKLIAVNAFLGIFAVVHGQASILSASLGLAAFAGFCWRTVPVGAEQP
jgi:hypothetical protein